MRKLAKEMADNGLLDPALATGIDNIRGEKQQGVRAGNWLMKDQANALLNAPDPTTLKGKRDRALLALLIGCGLRRAELLALEVDQIQQREGRWVVPDLVGKGKRIRTVPVPAAVKARIDEWLKAAEIDKGKIVSATLTTGRVKVGDSDLARRPAVLSAQPSSGRGARPSRACAQTNIIGHM